MSLIKYPFDVSDYRHRDLQIRFLERFETDRETGCWNWTGSLRGEYGCFYYAAHRISHWIYKGTIPAGLSVDHLCFNKLCVNPAHLEAVTPAENNRRAAVRRRAMKAAAA
jgi:hypothetical protein